jgi:hypothetical protein
VELSQLDAREAGLIERALADSVHQSNGGVIVTLSGASIKRRDLIIALTARRRLAAVYEDRFFVAGDGLISYGRGGPLLLSTFSC